MKLLVCILLDHRYRVCFDSFRRIPNAWSFCDRCGRQFTKSEFNLAAWGFWSRLWFTLGGYNDKKKVR